MLKAIKKLHSVLLVHHGLGDVIMTLPVLKAYQDVKESDEQHIIIVKSELERELLELYSLHEQYIILINDRKLALALFLIRFHKAKYFVALHGIPSLKLSLMAKIINAKVAIGIRGKWYKFGFTTEIDPPPDIHNYDLYKMFIEEFRMKFNTRINIPSVNKNKLNTASNLLGSTNYWIAFAPGSGEIEKHKRWPKEHFITLANMITRTHLNIRILVLGNKNELELIKSIRSEAINNNRILYYASSDLEISLYLLERMELLVTGCSGLSHMGYLANIQIIGLYGPTNPKKTGPITEKLQCIRQDLTCSPCYKTGYITGCNEPICMKTISPQQVFEVIERYMFSSIGKINK